MASTCEPVALVKKILGELEVDVKEETQSYANPFEVAALASTSADKGEAPSSGNGKGKAKAEDSPRDAPSSNTRSSMLAKTGTPNAAMVQVGTHGTRVEFSLWMRSSPSRSTAPPPS